MPDKIDGELRERISVPLTNQEIPLESFVALIESGIIQDEIPFDLIAQEYPDLLDDWYPGYPGFPREMTEKDPIYVEGRIEGEFLILYDVPGLDKIAISSLAKEEFGVGECKAWLKEDDGSWSVILQKHDD